MYLTGFADEAAKDIDGQIKAIKTLGWRHIESRAIDGTNIHDLTDAQFDIAAGKLEDAGVRINSFGSTIANWSKDIEKPFDEDLAAAKRAIPRMQRLGTKLIRIMSYPVIRGRPMEDQMQEERFRRLGILTRLFLDAGIQPVHENCMNYGGQGWRYTLELIEHVPGLKLVFDTGNPVNMQDLDHPGHRQSSWDFYDHVRDHVVYIHIKDGKPDGDGTKWTYCGEGDGDVKRICADLVARGYDGGISIEPHVSVVFHDKSVKAPEQAMFDSFVEYGHRLEGILRDCGAKID